MSPGKIYVFRLNAFLATAQGFALTDKADSERLDKLGSLVSDAGIWTPLSLVHGIRP